MQRDVETGRGDVRVSSGGLVRAMGWSKSKAERYLNRLVKEGEIRPLDRDTNRDTYRDTLGTSFFVVRYDELQPSTKTTGTPTGTPTGTLVRRKKKGKKVNGVAETPKSEGGDAVLTERPVTKKRRAAKKPRSLSEQRDFLAAEIRKSEADA